MTDLQLDHIEHADALTYLRSLPDDSVNLCVSSPPYFGLRDYGVDGQIGLEPTPTEYVAALVDIFREVRRVLRADGNCYVNLGDSYASFRDGKCVPQSISDGNQRSQPKSGARNRPAKTFEGTSIQHKSLMGIPWRFAFAMQDSGWLLREDIIWAKPAPMPESVRDRCTRAHEYIFHFTKGPKYWYDQQAVMEDAVGTGGGTFPSWLDDIQPKHGGESQYRKDGQSDETKRNRRSVWTVNTAGFAEAHFATFPEKLVEPMVLAGCPEWVCERCGAPYEAQVEKESYWEARKANGATGGAKTIGHNGTHGRGMAHDLGGGAVTHYGYAPSCTCNAGKRAGVVLDPFAGAGTTALVAKRLNRRYIGCDLNAEYVEMARRRVESIPYTLFSLMGAD